MSLKRRWYQFSLRTFIIAVTLACMGIGMWVHNSRSWIKRRHEALHSFAIALSGLEVYGSADRSSVSLDDPPAPGGLWLLGEKGVWAILCAESDVERVRRLFPEARINPYGSPARSQQTVPAWGPRPVPVSEH